MTAGAGVWLRETLGGKVSALFVPFFYFSEVVLLMKTSPVKTSLLVFGLFAVVIGLIWVGQGSGYFPFPKSSFMIDQRPWIWRGVGLALAGVVAVIVSRRLRR